MEFKQKKKSAFDRFMIWLLALLKKSVIGRFFTSYDASNAKFERRMKGGEYVSEKRLARFIERNPVLNFMPKIFQLMLRIPLRDYGIMLFLTGAVVVGLYPVDEMILFIKQISFEKFVVGAAVSVSSIPLFFSSKPIATNILSSRIFSSFFFGFLGLDEESYRIADEKGRVSFALYAVGIGLGLGYVAYLLTPLYTIAIVIGVFLAYCTVRTPEVGAVVTILLIPFFSVNFTCICVAFTFLCYVVKVLVGKRILKFQYFDLWVSTAIFVLTVTGINYKNPLDSLKEVSLNLVILLSYFLFSNLIYSKDWFRRSMLSFTASSMLVAFIAIAQGILRKLAINIEALENVFSKEGEIASTFGSPDVLTHFMVISIPFAFVHMLSEKKDIHKFIGFLLATIQTVALVLTDVPLGYVGLIVGVLLLLAFFNARAIYFIVLLMVSLPILYFTLPSSALDFLASHGPLEGVSIKRELAYIWDSFLEVIKKPLGVGVSRGGLVSEYGIEYFDSLPIQLLASYGVIGTLAFVIMVVMFARVILSYSETAKNEYRRVNGCAGLCSTIALLAVSTFDYIWIDKRVFLLFVMTMALSFAYIKIDKEEIIVTAERVDITQATIDIPLKEMVTGKSAPQRRYVSVSKISKRLNKAKKEKVAEAKEFSNTEELIVVRKKYEDEFDVEEQQEE